jgi:hypothetical protein
MNEELLILTKEDINNVANLANIIRNALFEQNISHPVSFNALSSLLVYMATDDWNIEKEDLLARISTAWDALSDFRARTKSK